jgi:hypothetical protein
MATVNKNFRIKHGLIVEGTTGTINGQPILTETGSDQYILDLIGGETLVKSVSNQFDVSVGGELSLDRTVVDAYYDAAGSAAAAQTAAATDATNKANAAQSAAEDYADGLASNYDAAGSAAAAQTAAESFATQAIANLVDSAPETLDTLNELAAALQDNPDIISDLQDIASGKQDTLTAGSNINITGSTISVTGLDSADISDFNTAALSATAAAYDAAGAAAAAQTAAEGFATQAIANLVDSAPATLDTLNELAAALQDNPDIISDLQDIAAGKQDTLTAGTGIDIASNTISVDVVDLVGGIAAGYVSTTEKFGKIAIDEVALHTALDSRYDASGAANTAQENAEDYADGLAANYDAAGSANAAQAAAALDATAKADAAQAAAEVHADGLVDNLVDGTTAFTEINVNDEAKHIAATSASLGSVVVTAYEWPKADYRSGKFLVKIDNGTDNEISEILVTLDSSNNVAITEYAIVGTNGSRGTITASVSGANVQLRVDPVNDSTIKVSGTLIK